MLAVITGTFDMNFIYFVLQTNIVYEYRAHLLIKMKHSSVQSIPQHFHLSNFIFLINIEFNFGRIVFVNHTCGLKWVFDSFDLAFIFFQMIEMHFLRSVLIQSLNYMFIIKFICCFTRNEIIDVSSSINSSKCISCLIQNIVPG